MADTVTAIIEDVASHTLNLPTPEIARSLKAGSLSIEGKPIKPGAKVTVNAGLLIQCGMSKVTIVPAHIDQLRRSQDGLPSNRERLAPRGYRKSKLN